MGMERSPQHTTSEIGWYDPEWVAIRCHWPNLSEADKFAWYYLWRTSRRGREEISVTGAMVATDYGRSGDAGLQRLKNLRSAGLLGEPSSANARGDHHWDTKTGRWTIRLPSPLDIGWHIVTSNPDAQVQLSFEFLRHLEPSSSDADDRRIVGGFTDGSWAVGSEAAPVAGTGAANGPPLNHRGRASEEAPAQPRSRSGEAPSARALSVSSGSSELASNNSNPSFIISPSSLAPTHTKQADNSDNASAYRGSAGGTSEASDFARLVEQRRQAAQPKTPPTVAQILTADSVSRRLPDEREQHRYAESLTKWMIDAVHDPRLAITPCHRLAWHIVEGRIERAEVAEILLRLDQLELAGKLTCPRGAFFVSCRDRLYRKRGIAIPTKHNPKPK